MTTSIALAPRVQAADMRATPPLRRLPVPSWEPPYDDEPGGAAHRRHSRPATQGTLALAFVLPSGVSALPSTPADLWLVQPRTAEDEADEIDFGPQRTERSSLPAPHGWAARFVQAIVEVLCAERPSSQLVRWTSAEVYDEVAARVLAERTDRPRAVVRSVHVTEPAEGVAEVAALVRRGARCTAVALRLEGLDGRWQCTALELG